MQRGERVAVGAATCVGVLMVSACASTSPLKSAARTPSPAAGSPSSSATPVGSAAATPTPAPSGPFAVVVSNQQRQGTTYDILLVNAAGTVVAKTTARLPLIKANQNVQPSLASATGSRAYFLDGDTDIKSLSPSGAVSTVKTIADGANAVLGFAVSADDSRIAVAVITQASDPSKSTGVGYVEDLAGTSNHVALWSNTGSDSLRWPVAWSGQLLIDGIGSCGGGYAGQGACSYHVIDAGSGSRTAAVCENPTPSPGATTNQYYTVEGYPVAGGTVCQENDSTHNADNTFSSRSTTMAVDWSGSERAFTTSTSAGTPLINCFLSPSAIVMACRDTTSGALTMLNADGSQKNLGRKYTTLGWIDASHLLVDIDSTHLGVVTTPGGDVTTIAADGADQMVFGGVLGAGS